MGTYEPSRRTTSRCLTSWPSARRKAFSAAWYARRCGGPYAATACDPTLTSTKCERLHTFHRRPGAANSSPPLPLKAAPLPAWAFPGAYMRAPNNPQRRVTMHRPSRSDGSFTAPNIVCVLPRAMPGNLCRGNTACAPISSGTRDETSGSVIGDGKRYWLNRQCLECSCPVVSPGWRSTTTTSS